LCISLYPLVNSCPLCSNIIHNASSLNDLSSAIYPSLRTQNYNVVQVWPDGRKYFGDRNFSEQ
jgi:hypothetical protein